MAGKTQVVYETEEIFTILAAHAITSGKVLPGPPDQTIAPHAKMSDQKLTITITFGDD